ncbi:MAG: FliO/MopB family protein [bacterium]
MREVAIFLLFVSLIALPLLSQTDDRGGAEREKIDRINEEIDRAKGIAPKESAPARPGGGEGTLDRGYFNYALMSLFVLLLLGIFAYILRAYYRRGRPIALGDEGLLTLIARLPIGGGKSIQILELAGKIIVLGVSENNISLLLEIDDKEIVDSIRLRQSAASAQKGRSFLQYFNGVLAKFNLEPVQPVQSSLNFIEEQRERLRKLTIESGERGHEKSS